MGLEISNFQAQFQVGNWTRLGTFDSNYTKLSLKISSKPTSGIFDSNKLTRRHRENASHFHDGLTPARVQDQDLDQRSQILHACTRAVYPIV